MRLLLFTKNISDSLDEIETVRTFTVKIYSQMSRNSTARGSCTGLVTVVPTKV